MFNINLMFIIPPSVLQYMWLYTKHLPMFINEVKLIVLSQERAQIPLGL